MARHAPFRTFDAAFAWLAARTNYETMATQRYDARTYGLARVERLLAAAGRPDRAFDVVQVVGSKGKGSTATALAEILRASGRRTGLFTSPHLVHPRERIRIDGRPAPDRIVRDALASLVPLVDAAAARGEALTFFEVHTVAALLAFRAARCEAVVLEAGMGGRLDATTAADAVCKVLTSISLDHTQHLGRTRAAVAREKAAAARRGVPLVCGEPATSAAGRVIAGICRRAGAPLIAIGREFRVTRVATSFDRATGRASTRFRVVAQLPAAGSDPERARGAPTATRGSQAGGLTPRGRGDERDRSRSRASRRGTPTRRGRVGEVPVGTGSDPERAWRAPTATRGSQAGGLTPRGRGDERDRSRSRASRRGTPTRRGRVGEVPGLTPCDLEVPLLGRHQATNAALAAVAAMTTRWTGGAVTADDIRTGLSRTSIRARLETLSTRPLVLVDGAHNPASFGVLARTVRDVAPTGPRVFIVGMSADKDIRASLRRLADVATSVVTTTSGQPRAATPAAVAAAARDAGLRARPADDLRAAMADARRRAGPRGTIVVTGSLYLCGEALRLWG